MVVVVYCYLLLTVHQATYRVREREAHTKAGFSLFNLYHHRISPFYALCSLIESPVGYLTKHKQYLTDRIFKSSSSLSVLMQACGRTVVILNPLQLWSRARFFNLSCSGQHWRTVVALRSSCV